MYCLNCGCVSYFVRACISYFKGQVIQCPDWFYYSRRLYEVIQEAILNVGVIYESSKS